MLALCAPAVVGAGIGGSATAHFLRQHFGPEVQVDVFEKGEVGGRLATVTVNHNDYESGGSIIHSLNLHMQEFVKQLGGFTHHIICGYISHQYEVTVSQMERKKKVLLFILISQ